MPKVTIIPSTINQKTRMPKLSKAKRRVAAYARVSTDSDEQFTSFEAQVDYYTKFIMANPDWEFVKVYADEGITGTNTKNRVQFNKMVDDALNGKIDLIVTKSVSRFARNTVDSLTTIRKLKDKGVECFFQKENIYTFDSKGELLLTIMASLAQEESRSISENVTWGTRKSFSDGKVHLAYKHFLGYRKGPDGRPEIVEEEAVIVRAIYRMFLEGCSYSQIAEELTARGFKTTRGKDKWNLSTIRSILKNEKYKGDAILQKTFTTDFLTHKHKINEGEVPQYYVENSHAAIIDPEEWDLVQLEIKRREDLGKTYSAKGPFACKIVCGECGGFYGLKVLHSTDPYKNSKYICNGKYKGDHVCETPSLTEDQIKAAFVKAFNRLNENKDSILEDCEMMYRLLDNTEEIDRAIAETNDEIEVVTGLTSNLIKENSAAAQDQVEYKKKYDRLCARYNRLLDKLSDLTKEKERKAAQKGSFRLFAEIYRRQSEVLDEWDEKVWTLTVDRVVVNKDRTLTFAFYSNQKITVEI